jgi:hypothetical protein
MLPCVTTEDQEGGSSPLMLRPSSTWPAARVEHYSSVVRRAVVGGACAALRHGRGSGRLSGPLMSCGAKDGDAAVRACGAVGFRGQRAAWSAPTMRVRGEGYTGWRCGLSRRGWQQDPRHLHP